LLLELAGLEDPLAGFRRRHVTFRIARRPIVHGRSELAPGRLRPFLRQGERMYGDSAVGARPNFSGWLLLIAIGVTWSVDPAPAKAQSPPDQSANGTAPAGEHASAEPSIPDQYRFAAGLYKQQRWELAADAFRKFLKMYPGHDRVPYARLYLGLALVNLDRYADARAVLREYAESYPQSKSLPDVLYRIAECSYLLNDLKSAETEFQRFMDRYPQHDLIEWALTYLGDTELRLGKPEPARDLFQKALAQYPKGRLADDSTYGLARADEALKKTDDASSLYAKLAADKNSPRAPQALMNLAAIQFHAAQYPEALDSFLRLPKEFPDSPLVSSARLNAGFSLYQMGQYRQAIEEFQGAAAEKRQALSAGYWKGISLKALGDYAQAAKDLKATYDADPNGPLAEPALFYRADCELRAGRADEARRLFLEIVQKWPDGEFADNGLHFAGEAALVSGSLDEAQELVERFQKQYPRSPLRLHEEILLGRVLNAKAAELSKHADGPDGKKNRRLAEEDRRAAIEHLQAVVSESRLPRTVALARFHLGRAFEDAGQHARVVEVLAPLVEQAGQPQAPVEAVEALAVSGHSSHELGREDEAIAALSRYLSLRPQGGQAGQVLADLALSNAKAGHKQAAAGNVAQLLRQFPRNPVATETSRRLAEVAYDARDWNTAAGYFSQMADLGTAGSDARRMGLSGLGWARFQSKAYKQSALAFQHCFEQYPVHNSQVAEAGFMRGRALQEAGQLSDAAAAYELAFQKLAPTSAAAMGEDVRPPAQYGFLAGVQGARLRARLKQHDAADTDYRSVVERFPKAQTLPQVLFDWANVLYASNNDPARRARVRETLRRIVSEFPESSVQDDARLFLAELDQMDGKTDAARRSFHDLLADSKSDAKVRENSLLRLVGLAVDQEDWRSVNELAGRFLAEYPASAQARLVRLHLASAQLGLKKPAEAEKNLAKLKDEITKAQAPPDWSARVWILLAEAFHRQKKYAEVETTVDELRHRMPHSGLLYQADEILGRTYKNQAQWDKAIAAFERVIKDREKEQNETAAKSQLMIAEIHFLRKDFGQAEQDYLKVVTLYNTLPGWSAPALYQAGVCEEELKRLDLARKTYADVIKNFPHSDYAKEAQKRLDDLGRTSSG
jgi:cellulose synthase operon protein C